MNGIVYKSTGSWYTVKLENGSFLDCRIKGKFRTKGIKSTNPVAVGDAVSVLVSDDTNEKVGVISVIHDRKNYIVRKSVNLSKQTHIIAANIDQMFILVTLKDPVTHLSFVDRLLATAEAYSVSVVLLFNKVDIYSEEELLEVKYLANMYREIGYTCLGVSAITGKNIDKLTSLMKDKVSMFSGHSGVGKSTLVNSIAPGLDLKTAKISDQHAQGQHTTTFAEMYELDFGAKIIDTPGIKGFGVVNMEKEEVGDYFPEFFKLKAACKFNNCLHIEEPHCAIKKALDKDQLSWSRYKSYVQMVNEDDNQYRSDIYGDNS